MYVTTENQQLLLQTECHVLALQELETIVGSDSQNLAARRQAASAVGELLGSAVASRNSSGHDLAMQSTSSEYMSPQLVAARNMHKENDERCDEITQALEQQDLCGSPNRDNPREGAPYHLLRHPLPLHGIGTHSTLEQTSCSRLLQHVLCYSFIMYCGTHPVFNTYQQMTHLGVAQVTGKMTFLTAEHVLSLTWPAAFSS